MERSTGDGRCRIAIRSQKAFVEAFMAQHKYHPCWGAHIGYMQTYVWALAAERAKSFYPVDVIKTLEVSKSDLFNSTLGKMWYDADNRQMVRPVPVVVGKVPGKMQIPDDFYEVLEVVPGAPPGMFGCHLGTIPDLIAAKGVLCPVRRC